MSIFVWGANSQGQLGLGFESELCALPTAIENLPFDTKDIIRIDGGGAHVLLLTKDQRLFACGWNHKGQLGNKSTQRSNKFVEVPHSEARQIADISCGWDSSAAIDSNGNLFVWGSNAFGQLGFTKKALSFSLVPVQLHLPNGRKAKQICFGLRFLCILCTDGTLFVTGRFKETQRFDLIKGDNTELLQLRDCPVPLVQQISAGNNHITLASENLVNGIGDNRFDQCQSVQLESNVRQLKSGWSHNAALTSDGKVFLYGRNTYGQLAHERVEETNVVQLECENRINEVHLGSEHGLAACEDGSCLTWGWNEHGNCGNGNEKNVFQPFRVNLPGKCKLCTTGAGFCYAIVNLGC